jgi:hypothetical protein
MRKLLYLDVYYKLRLKLLARGKRFSFFSTGIIDIIDIRLGWKDLPRSNTLAYNEHL